MVPTTIEAAPLDSAPAPLPKVHDDGAEPSDETFPNKAAAIPAAEADSGARLSGDDLLAELFEAFAELGFLHSPLDGAEFVLRLTLEKLPSEAAVASFFDINRREFVVVRTFGASEAALLSRVPEQADLAREAMTTHHSVVVEDATGDPRVDRERWSKAGVEVRSLICAPVELSGRYLGLIELANPKGGGGFSAGDGHALTYIGQQFAEFLSQRGVILDPEVIREQAKSAAARRR